ncbi:MAG: phosphatase PAP2 family protein [Gemmatimonadetes bacterium]|nr:phosphatase PAP2 family protein [Gemmatimonadota bacterium]
MIGSLDGAIQRWVREHPSALPLRLLEPLQEPRPLSYLGRSFALQPLSALLYLTGSALDSDALRDAGLGCATANIANSLPRHVVGRMTGRLRPRYSDDPYDFDPLAWSAWPRRSFPGGHGSNIMACASYWNHRFDLGPAGPLLYAFAVALGAARMASEAHWASDTVFGSILGWAVGRGIAGRFAGREPDDGAPAETGSPVTIGWRIPVP